MSVILGSKVVYMVGFSKLWVLSKQTAPMLGVSDSTVCMFCYNVA